MSRTTSKKVKVVGTEQYINMKDGTIQDMQVVSIQERDFNFTKVWMKNFINSLELLGNKKTQLAYWIIENLNKDNQLIFTYRQIQKETNYSLDTIRITMQTLQACNFLQKINTGAYMVNPDILFKGSHTGRLNMLNIYTDLQHENREKVTDETRLENLERAIEQLQTEALTLRRKIRSDQEETQKTSA